MAANIAVVQRHYENLEGIRSLVDKHSHPNNIRYFCFPEDAIAMARSQGLDLVVSGNCFDSPRFSDARDFSKIIKKINPQIFFVMYSAVSQQYEHVDAGIRKPCFACGEPSLHKPLADFLVCPDIGELIRAGNKDEIMRRFNCLSDLEGLPKTDREQFSFSIAELVEAMKKKR